MRPLSEATSRVASKNFSKKYIAIGRLVEQWTDIMGEDFASKAQPVKIHYRKTKDQKPCARLDIATSQSYATILAYQKDLILERINRIFGDKWITEVKFVISHTIDPPLTPKKANTPLTQDEKKYLSDVLDQISDQDYKQKLESLGKALLTDLKK